MWGRGLLCLAAWGVGVVRGALCQGCGAGGEAVMCAGVRRGVQSPVDGVWAAVCVTGLQWYVSALFAQGHACVSGASGHTSIVFIYLTLT